MLNREIQTERQYTLSQIALADTRRAKQAAPEPVALSLQWKQRMQADLKRNASGC
ncbi:hypothetical protein D3C77_462040 [compost metagenome]